jgi:hypothetical protein
LAKHFNVVCAVSGTLLLQLAIVFSTGLFALEQRTVTRHDVPITTNSRFANVSHDVDGRAFMKSLAILDYDLDYPFGTAETFAYQTFSVSHAGLRKCSSEKFQLDLDVQLVVQSWLGIAS